MLQILLKLSCMRHKICMYNCILHNSQAKEVDISFQNWKKTEWIFDWNLPGGQTLNEW